jgi:hypothetical protein
MKKTILVIIAITLFSTGFAQFTYGPKLGANVSKLPSDNMMPGFQAGGFLNGELYDRMGFQVDFLWTLKGTSNKTTDSVYTTTTNTVTGVSTTNTSTVSVLTGTYYRFVDIPICAYFPISKHIRGFFGPQISVFRHAEQDVTVGSSSTITKTALAGITTKTSICLGFDLKSNSPIIVGIRFVTNKFTGGSTTSGTQTLSSLMINVAYRLEW